MVVRHAFTDLGGTPGTPVSGLETCRAGRVRLRAVPRRPVPRSSPSPRSGKSTSGSLTTGREFSTARTPIRAVGIVPVTDAALRIPLERAPVAEVPRSPTPALLPVIAAVPVAGRPPLAEFPDTDPRVPRSGPCSLTAPTRLPLPRSTPVVRPPVPRAAPPGPAAPSDTSLGAPPRPRALPWPSPLPRPPPTPPP